MVLVVGDLVDFSFLDEAVERECEVVFDEFEEIAVVDEVISGEEGSELSGGVGT